MRWLCLFFHSWSKWKKFYLQIVNVKKSYEVSCQKRVCHRCNFEEWSNL